MNGLTGKIAVITGGTQGLGAAIARLFADRGASGIVTCGRSAAKGQAKAKEIQDATGTKVVFVAADLGKVEDCRTVIAKADAEFGRVDVLVNAAGITDRGTILDTSPELFDRIFNVNVRGPFFLMQETIKIMRREKIAGNIVNIGSMSSKAGQPFIAAYCSSKGALATLTENTAYAVHAQSYPRQRAEHRMDGHRRRRPNSDPASWCKPGLAERGGGGSTIWSSHRPATKLRAPWHFSRRMSPA